MTKKLPDMALTWSPERVAQYEAEIHQDRRYESDYEFIRPFLESNSFRSIIEFGCGHGFLAAMLPMVPYTGIDLNMHMIDRARFRNSPYGPSFRRFVCFDARNYQAEPADLVIAMHFLHLFGFLDNDFDRMLLKVLAHGKNAAFSLFLGEQDTDAGVEHHYVCVTRERVMNLIEAAGHQVVTTRNQPYRSAYGLTLDQVYFWTTRMEKPPEPEPKKTVHVPQQRLLVDGVIIADYTPYTVRWAGPIGEQVPVLYKDGKRVTGQWWLILDAPTPPDPDGGNANTT